MCIKIEKITENLSRAKLINHYQGKLKLDIPSTFWEIDKVEKLLIDGFINQNTEHNKWI